MTPTVAPASPFDAGIPVLTEVVVARQEPVAPPPKPPAVWRTGAAVQPTAIDLELEIAAVGEPEPAPAPPPAPAPSPAPPPAPASEIDMAELERRLLATLLPRVDAIVDDHVAGMLEHLRGTLHDAIGTAVAQAVREELHAGRTL